MFKELEKKFDDLYKDNGEEKIKVFSPSRINIIGEHIDYNGGYVFPCAIEIGTYGVARKNKENKVRLASGNFDFKKEFTYPLPSYDKENEWTNYPLGVISYLEDEGYEVGGVDIFLEGNIPNGAGLSSSASIELLIGEIMNLLYNQGKIDKLDLIKIGKRCENEYIGVNTGIMDQFIIGLGKKDHAMLLDTNSLDYNYVPFELGNNKIVIMSTNYRRELKDSKYNERRSESDKAFEILKKYKPEINYLCDLKEEDLNLLEKIEDPVIRKRAEHVVKENIRVLKAVEALKSGDIEELGRLLVQSDDSLRDLYEVTGPYLDSLTRAANSFEACLGARMTGAGFGGCAIAIVKENEVEKFKDHVEKIYTEETNLLPTFITSGVADGVGRVG